MHDFHTPDPVQPESHRRSTTPDRHADPDVAREAATAAPARAGRPIRTLTVTSLYPNVARPRHGIFTEHRIHSLVATGRARTRVVAPVIWAPPFFRHFPRYRENALALGADHRRGIDVIYPRYISLPKVSTLFQPLSMLSALYRTVMRMRNREEIDVIDGYYLYPDGVAAVFLGKLLGKPVVLTAYGSDVNVIPRRVLPRRMIRWACAHANAVTTVCGALRESLVRIGVPRDKIHVIYHGVDLGLFRPGGQREAVRDSLGFRAPTLLSVGHLVENKGHHVVIDALEHLPGVDLVIVGRGEMESALRRQVARKNLGHRVRFAGHVDQHDLVRYFEAADMLVLASAREGAANVLLESMACGTPVVATDVGGTGELVTSEACGRLIRDRTPAALAEAVRALFEAYPDRRATRRAAERFAWSTTAAQHLRLLEAVVATEKHDAVPDPAAGHAP